MRGGEIWRALVACGTAMATGSAVLTMVNAATIRVPNALAPSGDEPLSVLLPMRDEARHAGDCLRAVAAAADRWRGPVRIVVLDDDSSDGTADILADLAEQIPALEIVSGAGPIAGWLGKAWACEQLSCRAVERGVLVFVDADVRVAPNGFTASVATMRTAGLDMFCPYPRQVAGTPAERLIQPLLQWSWMSTLPLRLAERSARPSLSAANGQFLIVDATTYRRAGGHGAVRDEVLEDIALLRAVKAVGGRGVVGDGSRVASCRMYVGCREIRDGYRKSLWSAFGSPAGAAAVSALLMLTHVVPAVAALTGSRVGLFGYLAGVASRVVSARRTGGRALPDSLAHPISVVAFTGMTVDSVIAHRRGLLRWKGREINGV
ncbi:MULTISPECIES: glycosyltransferase [unclassified Gordonia (in: high G+C Gram-positive bacteria)]